MVVTQNELYSQSDQQFKTNSQDVTQLILENATNQTKLLYSGRAFVTSSDNIRQSEWDNFFKSQRVFDNPGLSSVFLVSSVNQNQLPTFINSLEISQSAKRSFSVTPAGNRSEYGLTRLLASPHNLSSTRNFDVFSTPVRKTVYDTAAANNQAVASQPIMLASGKSGFFITLPIYAKGGQTATEYMTASYRTEDFITDLYKQTGTTIASRVSDVTSRREQIPLFESKNWRSTPAELTKTDTLRFGTRTWKVEFKANREYTASSFVQLLPVLVMIGGLLIVAIVLYSRLRDEKLHARLTARH